MNNFWEKVEHWNAKLIPAAIVGLLIIIVLEVIGYFNESVHHFVELYHTPIVALDYFIIVIFVIDLIFLAIKAKTWKFFFKSYWLDIVAVVPLVIVFTIVSRVWRVAATAGKYTISQAILHESLEARKGISALSRSQKIAKYIRLAARSLRIVTKSRLFTKVTHHVHRHKPEYQKKHTKVLEKRNLKKNKNKK
ncbi:hypothetical protein HOE37_02615 [Candidatus Woesearchaeota archaeon]|jgi:hypothetical protein|nr:hypothetical protein [Candidatus Woesearchaeota archaeon]MBT4110725.1 hypothetical protein [Candidatus Woesearchaeota archaeon]MBT4336321.1 hypothetical protein [Candidatus Woesearchaeota archaeon]MBT4469318.1 hypothetical protein [Candidatus Woesearchaeota archaeon]MBT6743859.1 hypothetical protein [Candidatus Woesearchaeota archaeon]